MKQIDKIVKILLALKEFDRDNDANREWNKRNLGKDCTTINRRVLRMMIQREFFYNGAHTINNLITHLLSLEAIQPNPTSELTKHEHLKPSNDTRYFLNRVGIELQLLSLQKPIRHTHMTLDQFNRSNSENRKANMGTD